MSNIWQWWAGTSDEFFDLGSHKTKSEAAKAVKDAGVYGAICEAIIEPIDLSESFTSDEFINNLIEVFLNDYISEFGSTEETIASVTDTQWDALQTDVRTAIKKWQSDNKIQVFGDVFTQSRNHEDVGELI